MAWVRYRRLSAHQDGVHRVSNPFQEVLFNAAKDDGLVDVRHKAVLDKLLASGQYEIALERYGVTYDEHGVEQEAQIEGVVTDAGSEQETAPRPRGRPRK